MDETAKLLKLIHRIQTLARRLDTTREFAVHQHINHFYYMQKTAELTLLFEQLNETQERLAAITSRIDEQYGCIFTNWKRDIRWLHQFERPLKC
jgi:hypothetical protein